MLENYAKRKSMLEKSINSTEKLVQDKASRKELSLLKDKLEKNRFHLAVLGQFKRGKTSFINALLSKNLLPTAIVPLTSIITIIKYSRNMAIKVIFLDKKEKIINLKDLHLYVTEKDNPQNKKKVLVVEISYPSPYLKEGILLIDTPGIGSTFLHNTEMTYDYLKKIDAAIFLLSGDPPISQNELQFLKDIKEYIPKIFFVLNKIDYLQKKEIAEIKKFNEDILEKELGQKVTLFPLSAKLALEGKLEKHRQKLNNSNIIKFEEVLSRFFMEEKGSVLMLSIKNSLKRVIEESVSYYDLEINSCKMPIKDAEQKLQEFKDAANEIKKEQDEAEPIIKSEIGKIMDMIDDDLEEFKEKNEPSLMDELKKRLDQIKNLKNNEIVANIQKTYLEIIESIFEPWRIKEEEKVKERFEKIVSRFSQSSNRVIEKIKELSSELFKADIPHLPTKNTFTLESGLFYRTDEMFSILGHDLKLLLPKFAFRKLLWNKIKKNIYQHLDMNSGRIRYDFLQRLNNSSLNFISELNEKVDSIIQSIEQAIMKGINEKEKSEKNVNKFINHQKERIQLLNQLKEEIS